METNAIEQNTVIKAVVLDIEGTTCPVSFMSQTLFPYAQKQLDKQQPYERNSNLHKFKQ